MARSCNSQTSLYPIVKSTWFVPIVDFKKCIFLLQMRSFGNQWKIQSLYELQYYNCPACHYKNRSNQEFINHAYETHPESIENLKNITDVSMEGVKYPWDDIDIKAEESDNDYLDDDVPENNADFPFEDTVSQNIQKDANVVKSRRRSVKKTNYYEGDENEENPKNGDSASSEKEKYIPCILCKIYKNDQTLCRHAKISITSSTSDQIKTDFKGKKKHNRKHKNHKIVFPNPNEDEQKPDNDELSEEMDNSYTNDDYNDNNSVKSKCNVCGFEMENEKMKKDHILTEHRDIMMICFDCNDVFLSESELVSHSETYHSSDNTDNQNNENNTDDNLNNDDIENDMDSMMVEKTGDFSAINRNKLNEKSFNNLSKKFLKPKPNKCSMTKTRMPKKCGLKCRLCGKDFEEIKLLKDHLITNHRLTCPKCKESFETNINLQEHMKAMHRTAFEGRKSVKEKVNYLCHLCSKVFNVQSSLKEHLNSVHYQIRDHKCDICGKAFPNRNKLKYHVERAHEKIKNFLCDLCEKSFYSNGDLTRHKKCAHAESKNFICRHCGKPFATLGYQKLHEEVVHEGIKKHKCKLCEKSFGQSHQLKSHMKKNHHNYQAIQHISV